MRTVDEKELKRLKKKGGVRVKRKLGTGKKKSPEPETKDEAALSGAVEAESSAPASPLAADEVRTSMDNDHTHTVRLPDMKPYASMAASIAARDADIEVLIKHNTAAIRSFEKKLGTIKPVPRTPYRHQVVRRKDNLIDYVDSIPMEMKK